MRVLTAEELGVCDQMPGVLRKIADWNTIKSQAAYARHDLRGAYFYKNRAAELQAEAKRIEEKPL